jgi:hypothetical protein
MKEIKKISIKEVVGWLVLGVFVIFVVYSFLNKSNINSNFQNNSLKSSISQINFQPIYEIGEGYEIKGRMPFSNSNSNFNDYLNYLIQARKDSFKKDLQMIDKSALPLEMQNITSTLLIDYSLLTTSSRMVSLLLNSEEYILGMAHPAHSLYSVNYDLLKSKDVSFDDLFNVPESDYLNVLANYSKEDIQKQIQNGTYSSSLDYINESGGLLPELVNFHVFNITPSGLLITFSEYQVGPYASGITNVNIPWDKLKTIVNLSYLHSLIGF